MTPRIFVLVTVAVVSACGGRTPPTNAPNRAPAAALSESNTSDDYVVGPFVWKPQANEPGVRTYYIVRD